jgi:hypothetical protein
MDQHPGNPGPLRSDLVRGDFAATRSRKDERMGRESGAAGLAALAICEAILRSLTRNRVIDAAEARAILADAAAAHRAAAPLADGAAGDHEEAAALIERVLQGGNSVRHASRQAARTAVTAEGGREP